MNYTDRDRFRDTVNHVAHNNYLYYAGFTEPLIVKLQKENIIDSKTNIVEKFGIFNPVSVGSIQNSKQKLSDRNDLKQYYANEYISDDHFIDNNGVLHIKGSMYHFTRIRSPLRNAKSLREIEEFRFPKAQENDISHMKNQVVDAHKKGKVTVCHVGHIYEDAWQIRGYEEFLIDMIENPEICEYILDKLMERNLYIACAAAHAGVDFIKTGDDIANQGNLMFSIDQWRRFFKNRWVQIYNEVKQINPNIKIWYHSDGNISSVIPDLIDIGVDILNPLQPECLDIIKVKKMYGSRIVIDGGIGTQTTMPFGSPKQVREHVKECKDKLGYDGALIISPTHVLEPDVPIENILAFFDECKR